MLVKFLRGCRNMPIFSLTQQTARIVAAVMLGLGSLPSSGQALPPVMNILVLEADPGSRNIPYQKVNTNLGRNPVEITINNLIENIEGEIAVRVSSSSPHYPTPARVNGQMHAVYKLPNLDSIGYVVQVKDPNESDWLPLIPGGVFTYRKAGFHRRLGIQARITFIKLNNERLSIRDQSYTISDLFTVRLTRDSHQEILRRTQAMTTRMQTIHAPTCKASSGNQRLYLRQVRASAFPNIGSTYSDKFIDASFSVLCSNTKVDIFATVSDANDASNRSDILTNTGSAKGVSVQLLASSRNNTAGRTHCTATIPCLFGPDSRNKGTQHQFPLAPTGPVSTHKHAQLDFQTRYIRTGTITPGTVQARATVTFSYQ